MSSLKERLAHLQAEQERIEEEIRATYAESIRAEATEKICSDLMAEMLAEPPPFKRVQFPLEVTGITYDDIPVFRRDERASWVARLLIEQRWCTANRTANAQSSDLCTRPK